MDILELVDFPFYLSPITSIALLLGDLSPLSSLEDDEDDQADELEPLEQVSFRLGFPFYYYYTIIDLCDEFSFL